MSRIVTYGLGGHDETKPNNNIIEVIEIPDEEESNPDEAPTADA